MTIDWKYQVQMRTLPEDPWAGWAVTNTYETAVKEADWLRDGEGRYARVIGPNGTEYER